MKIISCLFLSFLSVVGMGQRTEVEVLHKIQSLQVETDGFYNPGLFPVKRSWNLSREPVEDNTIFFTASIVHTLKSVHPYLDLRSKTLTEALMAKAIGNYEYYRSRNGEPTYNFWQTIPPDLPFPHGNQWISNSKMRLPDDLDTSILIALSSGEDSIKSHLRQHMVRYAARKDRSESKLNTLKKYEESQAYEVWFAKAMPQTFDICVMSNALLFVLEEEYELNTYDLATADLIKRMVMENVMDANIDEVSHHTTSKALILYHLARLIAADSENLFGEIKPKVIEDLHAGLLKSTSELEKMLMNTSLIRLIGYTAYEVNTTRLEEELSGFTFFSVKPFLGNAQLAFLNKIVPDINWTCEAYNWTLYLEYLCLEKINTSTLSGTR